MKACVCVWVTLIREDSAMYLRSVLSFHAGFSQLRRLSKQKKHYHVDKTLSMHVCHVGILVPIQLIHSSLYVYTRLSPIIHWLSTACVIYLRER